MLAVACGEQDIAQLIDLATSNSNGSIRVACINSPESVTVSGDQPAIDALERMLGSSGVSARRLKVDTAYHSHHMEKIADSYLRSLQDIRFAETHKGVKFFSSVTGELKTSEFGASYWAENLVSQVRFSDALQALADDMTKSSPTRDSANILIEIGPHSALQGPIRQTLSRISNFKYSYYPSLIRGKDAAYTTLSAAAGIFQLGFPVNLESVLNMQVSDEVYRPVDDLPIYPWDHRTKHWHESRLSRDHRLRQFPYHDLLGLFDVVSTIHEPRWRYHVGVESLPWLRHHVVDGLVIWPGTAYICMALEAMKQLAQLRNPDSTVTSFTLRDSEVSKAVVVPEEQADGRKAEVEIQLVISRNGTSEIWESVRILSCQPDGAWIENFSGSATVDMASTSTADDAEGVGDEGTSILNDSIKKLESIKSLAQEAVDPAFLYSALREAGNDFGPSFTPITEASVGSCVGFAKLVVPDMRLYMPKSFLQPHTIHPATLDTVNHLVALLFHRECSKSPIMPTSIEETTVRCDSMINPGEELIIACEILPEGNRSAKANTWIFRHDNQSDDLALVSTTTNIQIRAIGEDIDGLGTQISSRNINSRISFHDDVEFLSNATFEQLMPTAYTNTTDLLSLEEQMALNDKAAAIHLERALATPIVRPPHAAPHLEYFYQWITDFLSSDLHDQLVKNLTTESERDSVIERSVESSVTGKLLARLGKHLRAITRGEVHSLSVMVEDGLWNKFYMDGALYASSLQAAKFIGLLAKNSPHMSILEVGAGTAGTTLPVLKALEDHGRYLLHRYCFTDISSGFFEQARDKLNEWRAFLDFKKLDVSKDPSEQDFELGSYDLIVAANVFHATKDVRQTLSNTRKLLKPGGRLVLCEITRPTVSSGVMFGSLPG
jgi:malonyl CoA-acyl carrier protein transacylase/2-polyprenyl-3-methyl-5-hydroxy-6-metoxy-1,4-benzoquinol methylase